jgi:hypothetical protein
VITISDLLVAHNPKLAMWIFLAALAMVGYGYYSFTHQ